MKETWFDGETGLLCLDEIVTKQSSFKKILEDGAISDDEVAEQSFKVLELLRALDEELDDAQHERVARLLTEMAVLFSISQYHELQQFKNK